MIARRPFLDDLGSPVGYGELADRLGIGLGERAPAAEIRDAVLELRRGKGMVLDAADHDTWSAGSFFTNPVVDAERRPGCPRGRRAGSSPTAPSRPAPRG